MSPSAAAWGFTGQREAVGLGGLYDYGARYYDVATGRFVSADTIVPEPGNPQALNRYAYTYNNPLAYVDPDGHDPRIVVIGLFAVAGAVGSGFGYVVTQRSLGQPIDPLELGVATVTGAVAGSLAPMASPAGLVGIGAGANIAQEVLPSLVKGEPIDRTEVVVSGALGGLTGRLPGGSSDAVENFVTQVGLQSLREAMGETSAEFGRAMIRQGATELVKEAGREAGRTIFWDFFNNINTDTLSEWFNAEPMDAVTPLIVDTTWGINTEGLQGDE